MAISLGTPTNSGNQTNSSGFSFAHTTEANTKCLVVVITGYDSSGSDSIVDTVVWDSAGVNESLTQIAGGRYRVGSDFQSIYYKTNPTIQGPKNITVTMIGACTDVQATAIGLIDASATSIVYDSYNTGTGTGSASGIVSPAATGSYAVGGGVAVGGTPASLSITTGAEISGSEVDMGSQTASCGTAAESGGSATITWTYSAVVCSALVATFNSLSNKLITPIENTSPGDSVTVNKTTWTQNISVADGTAPGDLAIIPKYINKSDGSAPNDSVSLTRTTIMLPISVEDGVDVGDFCGYFGDAAYVGDKVGLSFGSGSGPSNLDILVIDNTTSNDSVYAKPNALFISVQDGSVPGDSVTITKTIWSQNILVSDGTVPNDSILIKQSANIGVVDGMAPGDSNTVTLILMDLELEIVEEDGTSAGDSLSIYLNALFISVLDNTTPGDSAIVSLSGAAAPRNISVSDGTAPGDLVNLPKYLNISDGTVPGDSVTSSKTTWSLGISVQDGSNPGDSVAVALNALYILVSDGGVPGDSAIISLTSWSLNISQADNSTPGDSVQMNLESAGVPLNILIIPRGGTGVRII